MNFKNNNILKTNLDKNGIFRLILNNPSNQNTLSEEMIKCFQVALDQSANEKKIRVIIISAEGKTF